MSYILEALKKAQAERQLGSTPTIHAPQVHATPAGAADASRKPLMLIGAGCAVAAIALAAVLWPRPAAVPAAPPAEPVVNVVRVPVQPAAVPVQAAAVPAPVAAALPAPVPAPLAPQVQAPVPAPVVALRAPVQPAPAPVPKPAPAPAPAPVSEVVAQAEPAPPPAAEESLPGQRELPESIQRELPQLVFGGYIYSRNPADRLLLIDKVLRREGEEVAPGLRLERLLPKAAVLSYKGYRYRVPY
ncbi:MAG: general secretion pathway protein GspB [Pseudomonadota bacterium]